MKTACPWSGVRGEVTTQQWKLGSVAWLFWNRHTLLRTCVPGRGESHSSQETITRLGRHHQTLKTSLSSQTSRPQSWDTCVPTVHNLSSAPQFSVTTSVYISTWLWRFETELPRFLNDFLLCLLKPITLFFWSLI